MAITVKLDKLLANRKMRTKELSERVGITTSNLSNIRAGKAKAMRFETLSKICLVLGCQPADLLGYARRLTPGRVR
jgi:putative transcriptional regulator